MPFRTPTVTRHDKTLHRQTRSRLPLAVITAAIVFLILPAAANAGLRHHKPIELVNVHDRVYTGFDFEGAGNGYGDSSGVVRIAGRSHDITFKNCVFGTNKDGVGNGVKIVDTGEGMHDITFRNCRFKYQPRMGFECVGREVGSRKGYQHVNLIGCTFQPSAGEAISYDDNNGTAGHCLVRDNLVKGAGVGTRYNWGQVFEINGTHNMTVTGNTFHAGRDGILNLQMRDTRASGWRFSHNVVDARKIASGIDVKDTAQPVCASAVHGGVFTANRIFNLDAWNVAYLRDCHDMDWRTTRWIGPDHVPYETECTGNRF